MLIRTTIQQHDHETECDYCGEPLLVGDRVVYDEEEDALLGSYCSETCASKDTGAPAPRSAFVRYEFGGSFDGIRVTSDADPGL